MAPSNQSNNTMATSSTESDLYGNIHPIGSPELIEAKASSTLGGALNGEEDEELRASQPSATRRRSEMKARRWSTRRIMQLLVASTSLTTNHTVRVDAFSTEFLLRRPNRNSVLARSMIAPQQLGTFEELVVDEVDQRIVTLTEYTDLEFEQGWNLQKQRLEEHRATLKRQEPNSSFSTSNAVLLVQHQPVYTLGTASDADFILNEKKVPVVRMDRGGEVTYHGPGQWTIYPIFNLRQFKQDIHWYVRALEEVVILALQECGIDAAREDNVTGVWVQNKKVAAVGIACKSWITQHGVAINVTPESLSNFEGIVPCGLEGRQVGCVQDFLDESITMEQFKTYITSALEEVFQIRIVQDGT